MNEESKAAKNSRWTGTLEVFCLSSVEAIKDVLRRQENPERIESTVQKMSQRVRNKNKGRGKDETHKAGVCCATTSGESRKIPCNRAFEAKKDWAKSNCKANGAHGPQDRRTGKANVLRRLRSGEEADGAPCRLQKTTLCRVAVLPVSRQEAPDRVVSFEVIKQNVEDYDA